MGPGGPAGGLFAWLDGASEDGKVARADLRSSSAPSSVGDWDSAGLSIAFDIVAASAAGVVQGGQRAEAV